ncbi:MAG TPA: hypothetical protein HA362_01950 [Nanoarchaeota archaeon]|nr:hypothetical protein [Nanoarchaeota archaeon]
MKKTILFCLAALLMLTVAVSAIDAENTRYACEDIGGFCQRGSCPSPYVNATINGECGELVTADGQVYRTSDYNICCKLPTVSSPDANGNIVCGGGSDMERTEYNPRELEVVSPLHITKTRCEQQGNVYLFSGLYLSSDIYLSAQESLHTDIPYNIEKTAACPNGEFISGGVVSGDITADSARHMLRIENGQFVSRDGCNTFGEYYHNQPSDFVMGGDTIAVNFADEDAPRATVSGHAYILWGDVFFGCPEKDSNGRAATCSLSAEMRYLNSEADGVNQAGNEMLSLNYVNVNGNGFISERLGLETFNSRVPPETIDKLKEKVPGLVVIPLGNMKNIVLTKSFEQGSAYPYIITAKTAADGSSTFNYLKIKSSSTKPVNIDAIGSGRERRALTEEIGISASDTGETATIDITADAARVSEKKQTAFGVDAGCGSAAGSSRAAINVFIGDKKLVKATVCNQIAIIPPLPAGASAAISPAYDNHAGQISLNKETREITLRRDGNDYGDLELGMLPGYDKYVQSSAYHSDNDAEIICVGTPSVISVSNRLGNARLELSDDTVAIKPEGKLFAHLGFGFTAGLCNTETTRIETFECNAAGECTLDGTRVTGIMEGQQIGSALQSRRQANPQRRAAGEGQKAAGEILGYEYGSCSSNNDCQRGLTCFNRLCRATCSERNGFSADEGCFISVALNSKCVTQSSGQRLCEVECNTNSDCSAMDSPSVCTNGECLPASELPPFSEDAKAAGEEQKGIFTRAWDGIKGVFGVSAKTAQETNACAAAGGRCRDRCYFDSEDTSTSGAANDACFLTPIAGQPIETRRCCIPKQEEGQNGCEMIGGTCKAECDYSWWNVLINRGGSERPVSRDQIPAAYLFCNRGDSCCMPLSACVEAGSGHLCEDY